MIVGPCCLDGSRYVARPYIPEVHRGVALSLRCYRYRNHGRRGKGMDGHDGRNKGDDLRGVAVMLCSSDPNPQSLDIVSIVGGRL